MHGNYRPLLYIVRIHLHVPGGMCAIVVFTVWMCKLCRSQVYNFSIMSGRLFSWFKHCKLFI